MGEVYRALDTKLNRDVAIKLLSAPLADDPERLARMRREAQLLAALNHPNIAAIYGLEEAASPAGIQTPIDRTTPDVSSPGRSDLYERIALPPLRNPFQCTVAM